ncbi:MFS transporter [Arhodomonas sp. SL1]|uniref:MFS transporter n=1 Tax=Arhodomonas sp. SL1 TaxID=3425691 RepID=UPI003F8858C8
MTIMEQRLERAYRVLSGDDSDERACEAIPESACTDVPRNYVANVANGACTKLAEQIAGPNLVLPWLLGAVGTPAGLIGLLMPIKQVGALLPQLFVAGRIRAVARRKWVWAGAGGVQAVAMLLIALAVLVLPPVAAGVTVVAVFAAFSVASGTASVAFQDVTAKTVPKGRRGRLLSNRAFIGGVLTMVAGWAMQQWLGDGSAVAPYVIPVVVAAGLWAVAAVLFAVITEHPGATEGGRRLIDELGAGLGLVRRIRGYRRFLGVRALLLSVELAMPFYALHAQALFDDGLMVLGGFVITVGLGNVLSSPVWGRFSDRSSRTVLIASGVLAAAIAALALLVGLLPEALRSAWLYALVFVLLGIAEQGVRLGRKTYLVDAAPADERALYVAFSNTSVGLLALAGGALGVLAQWLGVAAVVALLGVLGAGGALMARIMPEAEHMLGGGQEGR